MSESTGELLLAAARTVRRRFREALVVWDVTPAQARALQVVCRDAPARLSVVAERLRIAPRSATEVVDALEQRGLVRREPDPADRRATFVLPTDQGRELRQVLDRARVEQTSAYLSRLSVGDRRELHRILEQLLEDG